MKTKRKEKTYLTNKIKYRKWEMSVASMAFRVIPVNLFLLCVMSSEQMESQRYRLHFKQTKIIVKKEVDL